MSDLLNSIERLMSARSPSEAQQIVLERVELLEPAAVEILLQLEDAARAAGDEKARRGYEQRRAFLQALRTGIETLNRAMEGLERSPATATSLSPKTNGQ